MNGDSFVAAAVIEGLGGSVPLSDYIAQIEGTDVLGPDSLEPVLLGLYGEVGGIMSASKKHVREGAAFPATARRLKRNSATPCGILPLFADASATRWRIYFPKRAQMVRTNGSVWPATMARARWRISLSRKRR